MTPCVMQPAILAHGVGYEVEGLHGGIDPGLLAEGEAAPGKGRDHQPVPIRQHLVVPAGMDAPFPDLPQDGAQARQSGLLILIAEFEVR